MGLGVVLASVNCRPFRDVGVTATEFDVIHFALGFIHHDTAAGVRRPCTLRSLWELAGVLERTVRRNIRNKSKA